MKRKQLSIKAFKTLLVAAAVLTISACSSGGSGSASGPVDPSSPLSGIWVQCAGNLQVTYTFTSSTWSEKKQFFTTEGCTGAPVADSGFEDFSFAGSYEIVGTGTSEGGLAVSNINITSETLNGTAVFESARVTQYNIVYTGTANQLIFGEFGRRSDENRPTLLLFDEPFVRQ